MSATYAMQGDVILAGPGAVVGFAGPRVIKQTIGQDLPEGFQTAEFLLEHGMVDAVVPRSELRDTTGQLLRHMAGRQPAEAADSVCCPSRTPAAFSSHDQGAASNGASDRPRGAC